MTVKRDDEIVSQTKIGCSREAGHGARWLGASKEEGGCWPGRESGYEIRRWGGKKNTRLKFWGKRRRKRNFGHQTAYHKPPAGSGRMERLFTRDKTMSLTGSVGELVIGGKKSPTARYWKHNHSYTRKAYRKNPRRGYYGRCRQAQTAVSPLDGKRKRLTAKAGGHV